MSANPRVREFQLSETKRLLKRNIKDLKTFSKLKTICNIFIGIVVVIAIYFFNPNQKRDLWNTIESKQKNKLITF